MSSSNPGHFLAQNSNSPNTGHFLAQSSPNAGHFLAQNMSNPLAIEKMEEDFNNDSNMNDYTDEFTENNSEEKQLKLKDVNALLKDDNEDDMEDDNENDFDEDDDRVEVCLSNQLKKKIFYRGFAYLRANPLNYGTAYRCSKYKIGCCARLNLDDYTNRVIKTIGVHTCPDLMAKIEAEKAIKEAEKARIEAEKAKIEAEQAQIEAKKMGWKQALNPTATSTPNKLEVSSSGENGNGTENSNSKIKLKNMNSLLKEEFVSPENNPMSNPLAIENMKGEMNNESETKLKDDNYLDDDYSNDNINEMLEVSLPNDPWAVDKIEDFQFFCCPSCDDKIQSKEEFLEHAINQHPESKETLDKVLANVPKKKPKRRKCGVCLRWSKNLDNHTCKEEYLQEALKQNNNYENGNGSNTNQSAISADGTEIKPDDIKKENVVTGDNDMDDEYYDYSDMVSCDISEDDSGMHPALLQAGYMQDKKTPKPKPRKRRCGECDACKRDDCGQCKPCSDLPRFGGSGQKKQACVNRKCTNMPLRLQDFDPAAHLAMLQEKANKVRKVFPCDRCDKVLGSKNALKYHSNVCGRPKKNDDLPDDTKCHLCGKSLRSKTALRYHLDNSTCQKPRPACELCGKEFTNQKFLERHIQTIHESDSYETKEKSNPNPLALGCPRYSSPNPNKPKSANWPCHLCSKLLSSKTALKFHVQNVHEGLRNFKCEYCNKGFSQSSNLKTHILNHHKGLKPTCTYCGKGFSTANFLRKHIASIHAGIRANCDFCGKSFSGQDSLRKHIQVIHEGGGYSNLSKVQQSQPFKTEGGNEEDGEYYDYSDMLNCEINEENDNEEDDNDSDIPESEAYEINEDSKEENV